MGFHASDIKILWAKAAGRCSMPECRNELIVEASDSVLSQNVLIGENCHIVADSDGGPRGKSTLSDKDRDRYPNLILLCRNHHRVVDQDPDAWPIELLHQIKSDHEIWVATQLTHCEETLADKLYSQLVNSATDNLLLANWDTISDHAVNCQLLNEFIKGAQTFHSIIFRTIWPGDKPELESALKNLDSRITNYIEHFLTLAYPDNSKTWWIEDRTWKDVYCQDYDERAEKSTEWKQKAFVMLLNVTVALNEYADAVRTNINSNYFFLQGKFVLCDSMGTTNDTNPINYMPDKYTPI